MDLFSPLNLNQKDRVFCFTFLFSSLAQKKQPTISRMCHLLLHINWKHNAKKKALLAPKVEYSAPTKIKIFSGCVCFCGSGFVLQTASWGGVTVDCHILLSQENMLRTCWAVLTGCCGHGRLCLHKHWAWMQETRLPFGHLASPETFKQLRVASEKEC